MTTSTVGVSQLPCQEVIDALTEQFPVVQEQGVAVTGLAFLASSLQLIVLVFRTFFSTSNLTLLTPLLFLCRVLPCLHFVCCHGETVCFWQTKQTTCADLTEGVGQPAETPVSVPSLHL
ncbi:MAG: hypothetical protein ACPGPH_05090 [Synechococcus sp.]